MRWSCLSIFPSQGSKVRAIFTWISSILCSSTCYLPLFNCLPFGHTFNIMYDMENIRKQQQKIRVHQRWPWQHYCQIVIGGMTLHHPSLKARDSCQHTRQNNYVTVIYHIWPDHSQPLDQWPPNTFWGLTGQILLDFSRTLQISPTSYTEPNQIKSKSNVFI